MKDCFSFYKLNVVLGFNLFKKSFFSEKKKIKWHSDTEKADFRK